MDRKFLFHFVLLSLVCFCHFVASAQVSRLPPEGQPGMKEIRHPRYNPWDQIPGFEEEKERLTLIAEMWKYNKDQDIYLIIFGSAKDKKSKADELGEKAANYLIDTYKIPKKNITIVVVQEFRAHIANMRMRTLIFNPEDIYKNWFEKLSKMKVGVSTKNDFERTFTPSDVEDMDTSNWRKEVNYKIYEGEVLVVYSAGNCSDMKEAICPICRKPPKDTTFDLPKDTIISLTFKPINYLKFLELNLNISQSKIKQGVKTNTWVYTNEDSGTNYGITDETKLDFVSFDLSKDQKQNLKCSNLPQP